jgi:hypothetical protein
MKWIREKIRLLVLVNWITLGYAATAGTTALVRIERADIRAICDPSMIALRYCENGLLVFSATIETSQMRNVESAYVS